MLVSVVLYLKMFLSGLQNKLPKNMSFYCKSNKRKQANPETYVQNFMARQICM